jgi:uncharacterized DUF497 family protein
MALAFEWDARKAAANFAKHGIRFVDAMTAFRDPLGRITLDPRSSYEQRFILLGRSSTDRLLAVMYTERGTDRIRLISARHATRLERIDYEEENG